MRFLLFSIFFSLIFTSCHHQGQDVKVTNSVVDSFIQLSVDSLQQLASELNTDDYNEAYYLILVKLQYAVNHLDSMAMEELNNREELRQIQAKLIDYQLVIDKKLNNWRKNSIVPDSVYTSDIDSNYQFFSYLVYKKFPAKFDSLVSENRHWLDSLTEIKKNITNKF